LDLERAHWENNFPEVYADDALNAEYIVRDHMGSILYLDKETYVDLIKIYGSNRKPFDLLKGPGYIRLTPLRGRRGGHAATLRAFNRKPSQNSPPRVRSFLLWRNLAPKWLRKGLPTLLTEVALVGSSKNSTDPLSDEKTVVLCLRGFSLMIRLLS
jgi:hypothetical protein